MADEAVATAPEERLPDGEALPPAVTALGAVEFDGEDPCSMHAAVSAINENNAIRVNHLIAYLLSDVLANREWIDDEGEGYPGVSAHVSTSCRKEDH